MRLSLGLSESISELKLELGFCASPRQSHPAQQEKLEFQGGFNKRGCRVVSSIIRGVRGLVFFFFPLRASFVSPRLQLRIDNSLGNCLYNYDLMVRCIDLATGSGMVFLSSSS